MRAYSDSQAADRGGHTVHGPGVSSHPAGRVGARGQGMLKCPFCSFLCLGSGSVPPKVES